MFLWHQNAIIYFRELQCQGLMTQLLSLPPVPPIPHTLNLCSGSYSLSSLGPAIGGQVALSLPGRDKQLSQHHAGSLSLSSREAVVVALHTVSPSSDG